MGQYDSTFDLKINVGLSDLYFMVQFDLKIIVSPVTYISWSIDFVLYLGDCLMYEHHYLGL